MSFRSLFLFLNMSQNKTQPTAQNPKDFILSVENETRKKDALVLLDIFSEITGKKAVMWGPSLIGFGQYDYKYESGREGSFFRTGFSPRKSNLALYIMPGFDNFQGLLEKLGKHKTGSSCLYINKLADIRIEVLSQLIRESLDHMRQKYPE